MAEYTVTGIAMGIILAPFPNVPAGQALATIKALSSQPAQANAATVKFAKQAFMAQAQARMIGKPTSLAQAQATII